MFNVIHPYSILFVEDEDSIRSNYVEYLKRYYKNVYEAQNGEVAYEIYCLKKPDILIVDINIPKLNGIELLEKIRINDFNTKAIMLTAHSDTNHLLKATELKLTKYLVKPITRIELKEALSLVHNELNNFKIIPTNKIKIDDNYFWDNNSMDLYYNNTTIELTPQEKKILQLFFDNINKTLSYEIIINFVWNDSYDDKLDSLKTLIKKLRKKTPDNLIKNVYAIGYKVII